MLKFPDVTIPPFPYSHRMLCRKAFEPSGKRKKAYQVEDIVADWSGVQWLDEHKFIAEYWGKITVDDRRRDVLVGNAMYNSETDTWVVGSIAEYGIIKSRWTYRSDMMAGKITVAGDGDSVALMLEKAGVTPTYQIVQEIIATASQAGLEAHQATVVALVGMYEETAFMESGNQAGTDADTYRGEILPPQT